MAVAAETDTRRLSFIADKSKSGGRGTWYIAGEEVTHQPQENRGTWTVAKRSSLTSQGSNNNALITTEVFSKYYQDLYTAAYWYGGQNRQDADDIIQTVMVRAIVQEGPIYPETAKQYIVTAVRNAARDYYDSQHRALRSRTVPLDTDNPLHHGQLSSAEEEVLRGDREKEQAENYRQLAQEPLLLYRLEGMSVTEIAKATGIPPGTIKSRTHAWKKKHQGWWEKRNSERQT